MLRALFIALSESTKLRRIAENSKAGRRVSDRFVAGITPEDALRVAKALNDTGMSVTVDNLGENVTNVDEANHSAALYHQMIDEIASRGLDANVSLKLTHMGFDVDPSHAEQIVRELVEHARRTAGFVRVDMEGSPYTQRTLDLVRKIHGEQGNAGHVGAVIQSYLIRSENDVRQLCDEGIRIRLCKGAYKEPPSIAFQKKSEVDESFIRLTKIMLTSGVYHGIATHDERIIEQTKAFALEEGLKEKFEFQMLHGIRRDLQESLVRDGWRVRIYVPFGTEWYPYFMRRLAERPANVLFIAKNLLRR
jgi:proline dehydrogenase